MERKGKDNLVVEDFHACWRLLKSTLMPTTQSTYLHLITHITTDVTFFQLCTSWVWLSNFCLPPPLLSIKKTYYSTLICYIMTEWSTWVYWALYSSEPMSAPLGFMSCMCLNKFLVSRVFLDTKCGHVADCMFGVWKVQVQMRSLYRDEFCPFINEASLLTAAPIDCCS